MHSSTHLLPLLTLYISLTLCTPTPTVQLPATSSGPAEFSPNPTPGGGSGKYKDSPHFRLYNYTTDAISTSMFNSLEAAYSCFVDDLGWRSTGLSFNFMPSTTDLNNTGPFYKLNVYNVGGIQGAAANTGTEGKTGLAFLNVMTQYLNTPSVFVHEFGHALTYAERYWIDQIRTGAWWETIANFVADTYLTNPVCGAARGRWNQSEGDTLFEPTKVISDSFQVLVDGTSGSGNYYQAFPFFSYLVANPDNFTGLGWGIFPALWTRYKKGSNETPLHVLERIIAPTKVQTVVARYWARMAFVDIGSAKMTAMWKKNRPKLNYANLDLVSTGNYMVKSARQPRYMGASIIPLKGAGNVTVTISSSSLANLTATLVVQGSAGTRYTEVKNGVGSVSVVGGEEAMLVVAYTPEVVLFDPFKLTAGDNKGVDYSVSLSGATA